ncbi:MAG: hypothetical protein NUV92_04865 [Ignavibacteria bacterium]|jgi:hypothetical protein|nr:hypothetical protein [Ignavibacteria bacterium]MDH7526834.1 hypothetical protein [Ignavibacteria bacterium]
MSRFFFVLSIGLLFLLSSCLKEVSQPIEPSVLKKFQLIPADPVNVIYLNLKNLKKSKYWKDFLVNDIEIQNRTRKTILDSIGIDFEKDIDEIIIATEWNGYNTFIITLNKPAKDLRLQTEFKDYGIYTDDKILFISNELNRVEKVKNDGVENNFTKNPLFRRIINSIQYKNHFWFVTRNTSLFLNLLKDGSQNDEKIGKLFRSINFINFSLKLEKDVSINSHWECTDEYKANLLRGVLNGIISAIILTEPDDPFVKELSRTDIFLENNGVDLQLKISREKINELRKSSIANKLKRITEYER